MVVGQFQEEIGGDGLVARIGELSHVTGVNARTLTTGHGGFARIEARLQSWVFGCRNEGGELAVVGGW
jgi:hypothetical protein